MLTFILNIGKAIISAACAVVKAVVTTVADIIEAPVNAIQKTKAAQKAAATPKSKQTVGQKVVGAAIKVVSLPLLGLSFLLRMVGSVFGTCYSSLSESIKSSKNEDETIEISEEDICINIDDEEEETATTGGAFCL